MKTLKQINTEIAHTMLVESIDQINDSVFLSEDLAKIAETHKNNKWSDALDEDEFDAHLEKLRREARSGI